MKIRPTSMTNRSSKAKHTTKGTLDTDIRVKRVQSHKEQLDTFVNTYGEKELKRFGIVKCETCDKRVYKDASELSLDRNITDETFICPECGRSYNNKGLLITTQLKNKDYESLAELFEGLKVDKKI